ncbi:hypothetical protein ACLOJK_020306 [Asimina triloba]
MAPSRTLDEVRRWVAVADDSKSFIEEALKDGGWVLAGARGSKARGARSDRRSPSFGRDADRVAAGCWKHGGRRRVCFRYGRVADDGRREASLVGLLAGASDGCGRRGWQMGWLSLLVGENGLAGACGRTVGCCSRRRSSPSFVDEEGRSWICNRDVVAVLSNGSNHPIRASLVVGCVGSRRGRWRFGDLDQLHIAVILGGLDLPCMSSPELTGCRPLMKAMEHRVWCTVNGVPADVDFVF